MHERVPDLVSGSIMRNLWKLALPMMVGNVLQTMFGIVDMIFVGRLGPEAIAAVSLSGSVLFVIMAATTGVSVGTTAMVSRAIGAGDRLKADRVAAQSVMLGIIVSGVLAVLGMLSSRRILMLIGARGETLVLAQSYLNIMFLGIVTVILLFLVMGIMQGAGDAKTPMKIIALSNVLNMGLDPVLIFGLLGVPALGVEGAALATVLSRGVFLLVGLYILVSGMTYVGIRLDGLRIELSIMRKIVEIGIPASVNLIIRSSAGVLFITIVAMYGTVAIATYGVGMRIDSVVLMPVFGLASASSTLVGQNLGARQPERAEATAMSAAKICALILCGVGALFYVVAPQIISVFTTSPEVIAMGTEYVRVVVFSYVFMAYGMVLAMSLNGAGDTTPPLVSTAISLIVFQVPLALLLPRVVGVKGLWVSIVVAAMVQSVIMLYVFKRGRWKQKHI
ncbi:MATE family efflux transporter [Methermicoccus shengliensis]|uniref:Multidrug-efflux transporter n=1 Tax=Methermicoccus shengliensis TaxID=660064 RepID=A0A832VXJ6_9EURY|nr:MATE family efflux transporter [Methermicoccus shengliensis]KUK04093.1 MAG: hypothetical protein XD46_1176 [Euryarchaeota archaeon 55_53]KUK29849.1 MAG: hypothetical protein XD62_1077 [Methanosarcinales archeaon 56_1174]MDI3488492.1 hypothetical protein [Methanosarcinales archaeon]MDN5294811.1 hypothetical protein [Methanosarcinales archaeon]HIH69813.1 MATE family efflux transporter [Methermicoccus shengliensis]